MTKAKLLSNDKRIQRYFKRKRVKKIFKREARWLKASMKYWPKPQ